MIMKKIVLLLLFSYNLGLGQFTAYRDPNPSNYRFLPIGFDQGDPNINALRWSPARNQRVMFDVVGTPYVADAYSDGTTTILGKKGISAPMRYNAAQDVIEFLDDDQKVKELLRRPYITATFNGKTYEVFSFLEEGKKKLAYFNRLNKGKIQLLFKPKKQIKVSQQLFQGKRQARYKDDSKYFLKKENEPAIMVALTKRDILAELHHNHDILKKFIDDAGLNIKEEADAVRLIKYYNKLDSPQAPPKKAQS